MSSNELSKGQKTLQSSALPTTRVLCREANAMNRTDEVKQRLGPIMERVKSSLARIHALEQSLVRDNVDEESEAVVGGRRIFVSGLGDVESRHFLKRSMGILKKKISILQQMEESLSASEDRRDHLQHYILQVSLSEPMMELASTRRRNRELEIQISTVEREFRKLQDKEAETKIANDQGCHTKSTDSVRSTWTEATDSETDSSTVNSMSDMETSSESHDVNASLSATHCQSQACDYYSSNPLDSSIDSSDDAHEDGLDSLHEVDTGFIYHENDEYAHSVVSHQGQGAALMMKLLSRIKKLEQENRDLKELVSMQSGQTSDYYSTSCSA